MTFPVRTRLVCVEATGTAGEYPATWGQASQYLAHDRSEHDRALILGVAMSVPVGCTVERLAEAVCAAVGAFDSVRSNLIWTPDRSSLRQRVHGSVPIEINVRSYPDLGSARQSLAKQEADTVPLSRIFDRPLNAVSVVCVDSRPVYLEWRVPHIFVDAWSMQALRDALLALLDCTTNTAELARSEQPHQRAKHEATPARKRASDRAIQHWRTTLEQFQDRDWSRPAAGPAHTYTVSLEPVAPQLDDLAARHSTSTSVVLIACLGAAVCTVTGVSKLVLQSDFCNRDSPQATAVTCLVQPAFVGIDPQAADSTEEYLRSVRLSGFKAYRHAQYEPFSWRRAVTGAEESTGRDFRTPLCFNDMRLPSLNSTARAGAHTSDEPVYLGRDEADAYSDLYAWPRNTTDGLILRVRGVESRFSRDTMERLLRLVPALVADLAADRWPGR